MRIAVIGTGTMGGRHAQVLSTLAGIDEVLVVDAVAARAEGLARDIGATPCTHDEALARADALVVATPAHHHAASVVAGVERGIPVLCEKPLTEDLDASVELVRQVEDAGAHVEVGFHRRHDPSYVAGRERVTADGAGRIHLLRLTAYDPRVTPRAPEEWTPSDTAPLFLHSSIHDFDFVRWMTGQEVVEVTAEGSGRDDARPPDVRGVETALVTMRGSGGTLAVLEATWLHPAGYDSRVEVLADGAHLAMGLSPRSPVEILDAPAEAGAATTWDGYLDRFAAAYRAELEAFLATCRGERAPSSSARDGLEAHRIAVAATRSYVERRTVALAEVRGARDREAA